MIVHVAPVSDTSNPRFFNISRCLSAGISIPVLRMNKSGEYLILRFSFGIFPPMPVPTISPPHASIIICAARANAIPVIVGSIPRSYLYDESVDIPNLFAVLRTDTGLKYALSSIMFSVLSVVMPRAPPITPANASAPASSAITISVSHKVCSFPNRSVNFSPFCAMRTVILPCISSASKQCIG